MRITLGQMKKLHSIQLEMFAELKRIMDMLGIRYYFVHGSLLSAITTHEFIEEDDDIDIGIFRKDYERLLAEGNKLISSQYFIQCSKNDDFPISFAKFRKNETAFDQPILKKHNCHKGIYIDIFPIDFLPEKETAIQKWKRIILQTRTNSRLSEKRGLKKKILVGISCIMYPSFKKAIFEREKLYSSHKEGKYVCIYGGKGTEKKIPSCWFGEGFLSDFCGIQVNCPTDSHAYLSQIYGENYLNKNPAQDRIHEDKTIEISASYIDFGDGETIGSK